MPVADHALLLFELRRHRRGELAEHGALLAGALDAVLASVPLLRLPG